MARSLLKLGIMAIIVFVGVGHSAGKASDFKSAGASDTGVKKGSGRCIAIANETTKPIELTFRVYTEKGSFFARLGKTRANVQKAFKLQPQEILSFNQKPKLSVFKGGVKGDYEYIEGLTLKILREDGAAENTIVLDHPKIAELNRYISRILDDEFACKDSDDDRNKFAIIVSEKADKQECNGKADATCTISLDEPYSLIVPFAPEKTLLSRLVRHGQQHKENIKELGRAVAIVAATVATGGAAAPAATAQLKNLTTQLVQSGKFKEELDSLGGMQDAVKLLTNTAEVLGFKEDLEKKFDGALNAIAAQVGGEQASKLMQGAASIGKQVFSGKATQETILKQLENFLGQAEKTAGSAEVTNADKEAVEGITAALVEATALSAQADQQQKEIEKEGGGSVSIQIEDEGETVDEAAEKVAEADEKRAEEEAVAAWKAMGY